LRSLVDSGEVLNNREAAGKIAKWVIELSRYDIIYKMRTIKAQALRDFMVEWSETHTPPKEIELEYWTINFDGSLQLLYCCVLWDSLRVINQANKEWSCLDDKMLLYCQGLHKLENNFDILEYLHILRGKNDITDEFAKLIEPPWK
jgi:hypothetical protein